MKQYPSAIVMALTLLVANGRAQEPAPYQPGPPAQSPTVIYHHASTYEEGVQRGAADLTRAAGEYNYNTSLAQINREEAIRRRIANRGYYAQTYFEMRRLNEAYRAAHRASAPTKQTLTACNDARRPERLTPLEFDITSDKLSWPLVLRRGEFAAERMAIDQVMAARTPENSGLGSTSYRRIRELFALTESKIRGLSDSISSTERIAARNFLASVLYEVRIPLPPDAARLAAK